MSFPDVIPIMGILPRSPLATSKFPLTAWINIANCVVLFIAVLSSAAIEYATKDLIFSCIVSYKCLAKSTVHWTTIFLARQIFAIDYFCLMHIISDAFCRPFVFFFLKISSSPAKGFKVWKNYHNL